MGFFENDIHKRRKNSGKYPIKVKNLEKTILWETMSFFKNVGHVSKLQNDHFYVL